MAIYLVPYGTVKRGSLGRERISCRGAADSPMKAALIAAENSRLPSLFLPVSFGLARLPWLAVTRALRSGIRA